MGRPPKKREEEPQQNDTPEKIDLGFEIDPTKVYIFETLKKSEIPRYENLGATTKAFDPEEKRYRDLRYVATAPSIFPEEWDESFLERPEEPLGFWRNQLTVLGEDIRKIEYIFNHPLYDQSPFRVMNRPAMYTLVDKEVQEQIKAKRHATEKRALDAIADMAIEDLRPIARVVFGITETSDLAIVNAMNEFVKKDKQGTKQSNAEKVLDNLTNKRLHREFNIQWGIDNGVLTVNRDKGEVMMGDTLVTHLNTKNAIKELVEYSLSDAGKNWYILLRSKVKLTLE